MAQRERFASDIDLVIIRKRSLRDTFISPLLGPLLAFYVLLGIGLMLLVAASVSSELRTHLSISDKPASILIPVGAGLLAALVKVYDMAETRLGTVDLFTHGILNVARVINASALVDGLILQYCCPQFAEYPESNRNEDYMSVFEKHLKDLGFLPRQAIAQITAFYTLLKGARDTRGMLSMFRDSKMTEDEVVLGKKGTILWTMYILFLALEAGYYAMHELVTDIDELKQYDYLFLRSAALIYLFLRQNMPHDGERWARLANKRRSELFDNALLSQYEPTYRMLLSASGQDARGS